MKINWRALITAILIPLVVGGVSALLTMNNMSMFDEIVKPPLAPPGWLFPVVWTILFILMGIASYLVYIQNSEDRGRALRVYGLQLIVNFFWSIIFFNIRAYLFAFYWLILLWILIIATMVLFYKINKTAGDLLIPYILWVTFAGYLTYAIYLLN